MKKQKTAVKKLRIGKETLLPLGSRQMIGVAGGATQFVHIPVGPMWSHVLHF